MKSAKHPLRLLAAYRRFWLVPLVLLLALLAALAVIENYTAH